MTSSAHPQWEKRATSHASASDDGENDHHDNSSQHTEDDSRAGATSKPLRQSAHVESEGLPSQNGKPDPKFWQGAGLILTVVLCVVIAIVVRVYDSKQGMPSGQKHGFETITTGLILFLGINFNEAFKTAAASLQKRLLKKKEWSEEHESIIKSFHSFQSLAKLAMFSRAKWWIRLVAISWVIAAALIAQVFVALISLTFSTQAASGPKGIYLSSGTVNSANLSCFYAYYNNKTGCGGDEQDITGQSLAHAYGELANAEPCCSYNDISQVINSDQKCPYYCKRTPNQQQFAYRFNEYNPEDTQQAFPRFTNRIITASSAPCRIYNQHDFEIRPNGLLFHYYNATTNGSILIPPEADAINGTTYVYRGFQTPQNANESWACGPRCLTIWVHRNRGYGEDPVHFACDITMTEVTNVTNTDRQNVSDDIARLTIASIALQGRQDSNGSWTQFQFYPYGSRWETHYHSPDEIGSNIAEYALGSLAFMARTNPPISHETKDSVPNLGSNLSVHWNYLIALLIVIGGLHFVMWALTRWLSRNGGSGDRDSDMSSKSNSNTAGALLWKKKNKKDRSDRPIRNSSTVAGAGAGAGQHHADPHSSSHSHSSPTWRRRRADEDEIPLTSLRL